MRSRQFGVLLIVFATLPATAPLAGGAPSDTGSTPITSCTEITEPGRYHLPENFTPPESARHTNPCRIRISANDVVLDGRNHTVNSSGIGEIITTTSRAEKNITIQHLRVKISQSLAGGIDLRANDSTVRNVDVYMQGSSISNVGIHLQGSNNTLTQSRLEGTYFGFLVEGDDATVTENVIAGGSHNGLSVSGENSLVKDNTFRGGVGEETGTNAQLQPGSDTRVINNTFSLGRTTTKNYTHTGLRLIGLAYSENVTVANNTVTAYKRIVGRETTIVQTYNTSDVTVRNNTLAARDGGSVVGARFGSNTRNITVANNAFVGLSTDFEFSRDAATDSIDVRRNVIYAGNQTNATGIVNRNATPVDARQNFWGAPNGPSSTPANDTDAPFQDPRTDTLANGSGVSVSEDPDDPGNASAYFDPTLFGFRPHRCEFPDLAAEPTGTNGPTLAFRHQSVHVISSPCERGTHERRWPYGETRKIR